MAMWLAGSAFTAFGAILVLVGSAHEGLRREFEAGLAEVGLLAAIVSAGLGLGVVLAGPLVDRWPRRPMLVGSMLGTALLLALAAFAPSFARLAVALGAVGAGAGAMETVLNATVAQVPPGEGRLGTTERRLSLVHAGATVGAVVSPFAIAALVEAGGVARAMLALSLVFGLLAVWAVAVPLASPPARDGASSDDPDGFWPGITPLLVAAAAYVGFETALTAFAPTLVAAPETGSGTGVVAISAFWLGLLASRMAFLFWRGDAGPRGVVGAAIGCGVIPALVLALGGPSELAFAAAGFAVGLVFPLLIADAARRFPARQGTAIGFVAGAGALGGALAPGAIGVLGEGFGLTAVWAALAACVAVFGLAALALGAPVQARSLRSGRNESALSPVGRSADGEGPMTNAAAAHRVPRPRESASHPVPVSPTEAPRRPGRDEESG